MATKIAIIGGSYLQKPLVDKAKELGLITICFSWEEGAVCKDICDEFYPISIIEKDDILKVCKRIGINGVVSIASDVAVITVNYIAAHLGLTGNSISSSELSTNKYLMRNVFRQNEILVPKFIGIDPGYDLSDLSNLVLPVIVKPVDRSGSKGITVVRRMKDMKEAISYALNESFTERVIVEEFIEGEEISVESISNNGDHCILTYTDKITSGYPHFVELEHHQPSKYATSKLYDEINEIVIKGINSLKIINGAAHSELIITKDKEVYLTEIGARMGGDFIGSDLVYLSTGFDYLRYVIEIAMGKKIDFDYNYKPLFSGVYFYTNKTKNVRNFLNVRNAKIVKSELNNDKLKTLQQSSDRSGYFIYQSDKKFII